MRYRIKTEGGPSEGSSNLTFVSNRNFKLPLLFLANPVFPPKSPIYASAKEDILQKDPGVQSFSEKN